MSEWMTLQQWRSREFSRYKRHIRFAGGNNRRGKRLFPPKLVRFRVYYVQGPSLLSRAFTTARACLLKYIYKVFRISRGERAKKIKLPGFSSDGFYDRFVRYKHVYNNKCARLEHLLLLLLCTALGRLWQWPEPENRYTERSKSGVLRNIQNLRIGRG